MSFTFKYYVIICLFSLPITTIQASNLTTTNQNPVISPVDLIAPLFFAGLISNVIGIGLIFEGITRVYDVPLTPMERIAQALEHRNNDELMKQRQTGRSIIGSMLGGAGVTSLLFGIINWAIIIKIIQERHKLYE